MRNMVARVKSIFGLRLFAVLALLILFWLVGYQFGFQERLDNGPIVQNVCREDGPSSCTNRVLGSDTEHAVRVPDEKKANRKLVYQEQSPDGEHNIVLYEMPFLGEGDLDYKNHLNNQYFYSVEDDSFTSGSETYVFVNDYKAGYPHWLDNEHIFFTSGCGTGCQGLYLVNTRTKESRQASVFTTPLGADNYETQFHDWFNQDFKFPGWSKNIRAAFFEGKSYLIFQVWNDNKPRGEERFLFTGKSLKKL